MYLKVYLKTPLPNNDELFISDSRPLRTLAAALVADGFLVSERVTIRWAVTGYDHGETQYRQEYFSATPAGRIVLPASSVDYLIERDGAPRAPPVAD